MLNNHLYNNKRIENIIAWQKNNLNRFKNRYPSRAEKAKDIDNDLIKYLPSKSIEELNFNKDGFN